MLSETLERIKRAGIAAAYCGAEVLSARLGKLAHIQKKGLTDFGNHPFALEKNEILATNGRIHTEMLELMRIKGTQ